MSFSISLKGSVLGCVRFLLIGGFSACIAHHAPRQLFQWLPTRRLVPGRPPPPVGCRLAFIREARGGWAGGRAAPRRLEPGRVRRRPGCPATALPMVSLPTPRAWRPRTPPVGRRLWHSSAKRAAVGVAGSPPAGGRVRRRAGCPAPDYPDSMSKAAFADLIAPNFNLCCKAREQNEMMDARFNYFHFPCSLSKKTKKKKKKV